MFNTSLYITIHRYCFFLRIEALSVPVLYPHMLAIPTLYVRFPLARVAFPPLDPGHRAPPFLLVLTIKMKSGEVLGKIRGNNLAKLQIIVLLVIRQL